MNILIDCHVVAIQPFFYSQIYAQNSKTLSNK